MSEFVKSMTSAWLALSLLGLKQAQTIVMPRNGDTRTGPATRSLGSLTDSVADQFGDTMLSTFRTLDNLQRGVLGVGFDMIFPMMAYMVRARKTEPRLETHYQYDRDYRGPQPTDPPPYAAGPTQNEKLRHERPYVDEREVRHQTTRTRGENGHGYRVTQIGDDHAI